MSDDIVTRLRRHADAGVPSYTKQLDTEAADEILSYRGTVRALDEEIERLRLLVEAWRSEALMWHHDYCRGKCDCIKVLDNNVNEWLENYGD